jgi:hypothetical protein
MDITRPSKPDRVAAVLLLVLGAALAAGLHAGQLAPKLETVLKDAPSDAMIPVIVETRAQGDLRSLPPLSSYDGKVAYLRATAAEAQQEVLSWLQTVPVEDVKPLWLVSRVALHAPCSVILELAARDDVATVWFDDTVRLDPVRPSQAARDATDGPTWNIERIKADSCWAQGYDGTGVVVGNIDTRRSAVAGARRTAGSTPLRAGPHPTTTPRRAMGLIQWAS